MKFKALIIGLALSTSATAEQPGSAYFGADYHIGSYDEDGFSKASPTGLTGKMGKFINENMAVEGRLTIGLADDTISYLGSDIDLEIDTIISVFALGHAPLSETASVYGLIGFSKGEITATINGFSIAGDDSGLSYGAGLKFAVNQDTSLNAEYVMYLDESDYSYTAFNIGFSRYF